MENPDIVLLRKMLHADKVAWDSLVHKYINAGDIPLWFNYSKYEPVLQSLEESLQDLTDTVESYIEKDAGEDY
jgi:hypothetical protein